MRQRSNCSANLTMLTTPIAAIRCYPDAQTGSDSPPPYSRRSQLQTSSEHGDDAASVRTNSRFLGGRVGDAPRSENMIVPRRRPLITYSKKRTAQLPEEASNVGSGHIREQPRTPTAQHSPLKKRRLPDVGGLPLVPALDDLPSSPSVSISYSR